MKNKQIIVDNVNVSECEFCDWKGSNIPQCRLRLASFETTCKGYNCYYKQSKHKEQECEELKKRLESFQKDYSKLYQVVENKGYIKELDQLKAENEELKTMLKDLSYENQKFCYQIEEQTKQLEPFKDEYFKGLDNVVIAELAKKSIRITAENSKLEQTLAEIKEIAECMHDLWINKTTYTDMDNLVKHLLECELNRIRYKLDEISEHYNTW